MEPYSKLAEYYDRLTTDVPYEAMAERIHTLLEKGPLNTRLVLELACGTGTLSALLSGRGYEMISADASPDMLDIARQKCLHMPTPPVFICQDMCGLDLFGTVQAAVCCLDSINYLEDLARLKRAFTLVSLFLEPKGLFIFDIKSVEMFEGMAGTSSVYDGDGLYCVWQYGYDRHNRRAAHAVDIFERRAGRYDRYTEVHFQQAFTRLQIESALNDAGLRLKGVYQNYSARKAEDEAGRLLFVAEKR